MVVLAPYLKMYTDYVKHFEAALGFVEKWELQSKEFAAMLKDVVAHVSGLRVCYDVT